METLVQVLFLAIMGHYVQQSSNLTGFDFQLEISNKCQQDSEGDLVLKLPILQETGRKLWLSLM